MVRVGCVVGVSVGVGVWREDDCVICGEGGMCVVFCWKPSKGAPANVLSHVSCVGGAGGVAAAHRLRLH